MTKSNNFAGLTNEELVVIHARFKDHLANMDKMLQEKTFMRNINLSKNGGAVIKVPLGNGEAEKILESEYYQITKRVVDKLSTVVEIIQESTDIEVPHVNNL